MGCASAVDGCSEAIARGKAMLLRCPVCRFPFLKVKDGQIIVAILQKVLERTQGRMTCPGRNTSFGTSLP